MESSDAQTVAMNTAQGFQVFECKQCADKIRQALLAAGHRGQRIEIRGAGGRDFMICVSYDGGQATITQNGKHLGIRVGDIVVDNLHPHGMPFEQWIKDFDAIGGVVVHSVVDFQEMAMSGVLTLLKEMRGRLGMYLGVPSIVRLAAFLRGYELAMEKIDGGAADPVLPAFRDWIHQRFHSSQHSWEDTILLHSADEADAVKRFWTLLDEFVKEHPQAPPITNSPDANGIDRAALGSRVGEP